MRLSVAAALTTLSALPAVLGHGYVQEVTLGSTKYPGYNPNTDPYYKLVSFLFIGQIRSTYRRITLHSPPPQRIVRKVPGNGPVENLSLIDVQCNGYTAGGAAGSAPAPVVGTVAAGAQVSINWTTWPSDSHKVRNSRALDI